MNPLLGGALIGAGASSLGGLASGLFAGRTARINYEYGERAAQNAYQRQIEQWNRENAYNTPEEQRKRLETAGLNPALMYGTGSGANTAGGLSSVPQNQSAGTLRSPVIPDMMDMMLKFAQAKNIDAQTKKTEGETIQPGLMTESVNLANSLSEQNLINAQTRNDLDRLNLDVQSSLRDTNIATAKQSLNNIINTGDKIIADTIGSMNENSMYPERLELLRKNLISVSAQVALANARTQLASTESRLSEAQIREVEQRLQAIAQSMSESVSRSGMYDAVANRTYQETTINAPKARNANVTYWTDYSKGILNSLTSVAGVLLRNPFAAVSAMQGH